MDWLDLNSASVAIGAFLGAALSVAVSELIKFQSSRRTKRDTVRVDQLTDAVLSLSSNARTMLHAVGRNRTEIDQHVVGDAHAAVRIAVDHLRIVGTSDVQQAARLVQHHVYALRQVAQGKTDPHEDYGLSAYRRTEHAIEHLLTQVRRQLGVSGKVEPEPDYRVLTSRLLLARPSQTRVTEQSPPSGVTT